MHQSETYVYLISIAMLLPFLPKEYNVTDFVCYQAACLLY